MPLSNRSNNRTDNQPATVGASDAPPNNKPPFAYGLLHQLRPHKVTLTLTLIRTLILTSILT